MHWGTLKTLDEHTTLDPQIFLIDRERASAKLQDVLDGKATILELKTYFPEQVPDFVAAYLTTLDINVRIDIDSRCLIVSSTEAWNRACERYRNHILVATTAIDLSGNEGVSYLRRARIAGHSVIYGNLPGGKTDENSVPLAQPEIYWLGKALIKSGYNERRAETLSQRSGGNITTLLRILHNMPMILESVQDDETDSVITALLLGAWNENYPSDCIVAAAISAKSYEEWIGGIHRISHRLGTPLTHQDGKWRFVARYQGWYALGPQIFDKHLDRFCESTVVILREKDPKFDLPTEERYAAQIHGKVPFHSSIIRNGLAESLALLGSQSRALTQSSFKKAERVAILAVRKILNDADWVLWASLKDDLPFLAEAAPNEFLDAVETALRNDPCPFDGLFTQESSGMFGATYTTGLLWALETMAWDPDHLVRVISVLGALAARDPGGNWTNRPSNSLIAILVPWLPQTCAPFSKRKAALNILIDEHPDVAWKLLLSLLPGAHQVSDFTRKPVWRETIPDDWCSGVTKAEYREQTLYYAELALNVSKTNVSWLVEIVERLAELPQPIREQLFIHLESEAVIKLQDCDRGRLWSALVNLAVEHRRYNDADWALPPQLVDSIEAIAERLAPTSPHLLYKRLFIECDFELYAEKGNYEDQAKLLEEERQRAIIKIYDVGGARAVIDFVTSVQSPRKVGYSFGSNAHADSDEIVMPELLDGENRTLTQFACGYIYGRFRVDGWEWVDNIDMTSWTPAQKAIFLVQMPFVREAWERAGCLLGKEESRYWMMVNDYPRGEEKDVGLAINNYIKFGRPGMAIECLFFELNDRKILDNVRAVTALLGLVNSSEIQTRMDNYQIVQIIKKLQDDPKTNQDDLFKVEWAYLAVLEMDEDAHPKLLEHLLASDPDFFCEIIRHVYRSKNEGRPSEEPIEQARILAANCNRLLYGWKTPPGLNEDGCYDGAALVAWLKVVKKKCSETGHLVIALEHIGKVLVYAPPDPDGLWLHRSVAAVLNQDDAEHLRFGFRLELFNSRETQVRWLDSTAEPEKHLVTKYRKQAEEVEVAGFYRLATSLRELAEEYGCEAERISTRGIIDN
jgi:hypothetical protein